MFVLDSQGATYEVDEGLRTRADQLSRTDPYKDMISHVDIDQVVFLRLSGSKAKWMGKCMYVGKAPATIIPRYMLMKLKEFGVVDMSNVSGLNEDFFDIRFLIIINDDLIALAENEPQTVEDITLVHEMMHIHPDGDKLNKHDMEDFTDLVVKFGPLWTHGIFPEINEAPVHVTSDQVAIPQPVSPLPPVPVSAPSENWNPEESD